MKTQSITRRSAAAVALLCGALALLASCAGNSVVHMYSLDPLCEQAGKAAAGPSVCFGTIELPSYLRGAPMARRIAKHEVTLADGYQWIQPLDEALPLCLEENLRRLLNVLDVERAPATFKNHDRVVDVKVIDFAQSPGGPVLLDVLWRIRTSADKRLSIGRKSYSQDVADVESYADIAEAHSQALAAFSVDLAADLRKSQAADKQQ